MIGMEGADEVVGNSLDGMEFISRIARTLQVKAKLRGCGVRVR